MQKRQNRWLVAVGTVGVQVSLGAIYIFSALILPLDELHGWAKSDVTLAFSLAVLLLGFSAAFFGPMVERIGSQKAIRLSAALYTSGIAGAGLGIHLGILPLFIISYGVIGGIGLGIGYIAPIPTVLKWFPDKRGMASGMAVMGFGFGSLVFGPVMVAMMKFLPVWTVIYALAGIYGTILILASYVVKPPPEDWSPAPGTASAQSREAEAQKPAGMAVDLTAKEALRTPRFYYLWLMIFMGTCVGLGIISVASPMAQEMTGMTALQAAGLVGMIGLFNGIGRFFWASVSDYTGRATAYTIFFALQFGACLLLAQATSQAVFYVLVLLVISCYGGIFGCLPAIISDIFGARQLATIWGYAFTAYSIAGFVGPTMVTQLVAHTGNYTLTLYIMAGAMAAMLAVSLLMLAAVRRLRRESE